MKNMMIGAAILAAATGSANAQLNYNGLTTAAMYGRITTNVDGAYVFTNLLGAGGVPAFKSYTTPHIVSGTIVPNSQQQYPEYFNSASVQATLTSEASSTRMEMSWDYAGTASIVSGTDGNVAELTTSMNVTLKGQIGFDSNCRIRITFNYGGDGHSSSTGNARLRVIDNLNWPYGPLTAASNEPGSLPVPLVFEADVLAGQVFQFDMTASSGVSNLIPGASEGWSHAIHGTFVVEVIPAPSAAAMLGLGGLVAARRRRA